MQIPSDGLLMGAVLSISYLFGWSVFNRHRAGMSQVHSALVLLIGSVAFCAPMPKRVHDVLGLLMGALVLGLFLNVRERRRTP